MTPAQRQTITRHRGHDHSWLWLAAIGLTFAVVMTWLHGWEEVKAMERTIRSQQQPCMLGQYADADNARHDRVLRILADHDRRFGVLSKVIDAIEHRRGNTAPSLLDEARYRSAPELAPFVAGTGEVSQ